MSDADRSDGGRFTPGNGPWDVSGEAIAAGTITGESHKKITEGAIEALAPTLADDSRSHEYATDGAVVVDHGDTARDVVGEVTESRFDADADPPTVEYAASIDDPQMARGIDRGRLEVSPRIRHATKTFELDRTDDGIPIVKSADAGRLIHLSVEAGTRSPGSTTRSGPLDGRTETADAAPRPFRPDSTTNSGTTMTDMSSTNDSTTDDGESIDDLREKVEQAREHGFSGAVKLYERKIADLRAGGTPESGTAETDLAADDPDTGGSDTTDADLAAQADAIGWSGAARRVRERSGTDLAANEDPDADAGVTATDMSAAEAAERVNDLRNKRATALRMGEESMVDHYEQQISDLMDD